MRKFIDRIMNRIENENLSKRALKGQMLSSMLTIVVSLGVLCSGSWAYFTDSVSTSVNAIQSAEVQIEIQAPGTVTEKTERAASEGKTFITTESGAHTFVIKANKGNGYCTILISQGSEPVTTYYTKTLSASEEMTLNIQAVDGCTISFLTSWGKQPENVTLFENGEMIGFSSEDELQNAQDDPEETDGVVPPTADPENTSKEEEPSVTPETPADEGEENAPKNPQDEGETEEPNPEDTDSNS